MAPNDRSAAAARTPDARSERGALTIILASPETCTVAPRRDSHVRMPATPGSAGRHPRESGSLRRCGTLQRGGGGECCEAASPGRSGAHGLRGGRRAERIGGHTTSNDPAMPHLGEMADDAECAPALACRDETPADTCFRKVECARFLRNDDCSLKQVDQTVN